MDSITIGRSSNCDIQVTGDSTVSGEHCRIYRTNGHYIFENLGKNGSTLNGQYLRGRVEIAFGAPVMIGAKTMLPWKIIANMLPLGPVQPGTPGVGGTNGRTVAYGQPARPQQSGHTVPVSPAPVYNNYPPAPAYSEPEENYNPDDTCGFGWWILSFLVPLVGLILFFVWKNERPNRARKCCLIPAIISFAVGVTLNIISVAL